MKPFVLWLNKAEIDEIIYTLVKGEKKSRNITKNELINVDGLIEFNQELLKQNNNLIEVLKNIRPLTKHDKIKVQKLAKKQKCEEYRKLLDDFKTHCNKLDNTTELPVFDDNSLCEECNISAEDLSN